MGRGFCADVQLGVIGVGVETETMAAEAITNRKDVYCK